MPGQDNSDLVEEVTLIDGLDDRVTATGCRRLSVSPSKEAKRMKDANESSSLHFPDLPPPTHPRLSEDEGINDGFVDTIAFLTVPTNGFLSFL